MSLKRIPIADATAAQLREYANQALGLTIHPNANKATIMAELANVGTTEFIVVSEAVAPAPGHVQHVNAGDAMSGAPDPNAQKEAYETWLEEKVMITLQPDSGPGGKDPLPVGLNEKMILVPRGQQVPLARKHILCIQEAKYMHYEPNPDGNGMQPGELRPLYNMQIFGLAA